MSRFIEMLEKTGEQAPSPLGFAPAVTRDAAPPQIALVARVLAEDLARDPALAEADAVALLLGAEYPLADVVVEALKDRLWGVRLGPPPSAFTAEQVRSLAEQGCDFFVFESLETEAAVLNDHDLGRIATLTPDMDEEVVQAVAVLPVDAALFGPELSRQPLTVGDLVKVGKVRRLVDRPFIVEAPAGVQKADVEALRNMGVDGLIVDVPPLDRAAEVKAMIDALPRRPTRRGRADALVPGAAGEDEDFDEL